MSKRCKHETVSITWTPDGKEFSRRCSTTFGCGAQLSLGESDEVPVAMEIRAAELAQAERHDLSGWPVGLGTGLHGPHGWSGHEHGDDAIEETDSYRAGWLVREIATHDYRKFRDATAWPWDPSRPVLGQFEAWVAKTDRAIEAAGDQAAADTFFDGDVDAFHAYEGATDSDAPTLAPTTPLLAIATAGVKTQAEVEEARSQACTAALVADLGAKGPAFDTINDAFDADDDIDTDPPTDPATKFGALAAQVVVPVVDTAFDFDCGAEGTGDVLGNVYTDDHAAIASITPALMADQDDEVAERAWMDHRCTDACDDRPITSGADHIGLTPRMVREQQAAADAAEETIREQTRHDVAASYVRHDDIETGGEG